MLTFSHPGKIGDLLYSLHYCVERAESIGDPCFMFNIQTGRSPVQINPGWNDSTPLLTDKDAAFIKPLLDVQPYIAHVDINGENAGVDLASYMCCSLNQMGGDIRDYYYQVDGNLYKREFWRQMIYVDRDAKYGHHREHLVIGRTWRYDNLLVDWKALEQFADRLVFLGTDEEHERFCKECFDVTGMIPGEGDSLLDCARLMASCKGYVGGQSGMYALAELMKIPRVLITPDWMIPEGTQPVDGRIHAAPGPKNVNPLGGECATANRTERLIAALETMLA